MFIFVMQFEISCQQCFSSVTTSLFCDFSYKFHDSSRRSQLVTPVFHLLVCTFTESLASRIEVRCLLLS